jgi:two-component system sensor kinase
MASTLAERYEVRARLRDGPGVVTLLAADVRDGALVVIKRLPAAELRSGARASLERDVELLRRVPARWLVPPVELGEEGGELWVVRPFVPGLGLEERLRHAPLGAREAIRVGICMLLALDEAHGAGVLHGDVRPSNVIVADGDPGSEARLVDAGVALSLARRGEDRGGAGLDEVRYLSPEGAGLMDRRVDERSDLYATGLVLHECLAGRPAVEGGSVGELLRQHVAVPAPDLRRLGLRIPPGLDEVIRRLLRKDPDDRYGSARAALADLEELAAALDRGTAEPRIVVGQHDRRRSLTEPAFVGRAEELGALERELGRAREGAAGLVLMESESGGGKTRLLDELARLGATRGARVMRGQGVDEAAQRPLQVLAGVAADLIRESRADPDLMPRIERGLGEHLEAARAALPELGEALGAGSAEDLGPETFGEARTLEALTRLMDALSDDERPALVLLDDCQWADEATLKLVERWRRRLAADGGPRTMVVAAFRSEEVAAEHPLRRVPASTHLILPPFAPEDLRSLAESMAGGLPAEALEVVERLSEGNPFMASAVLRGLVEVGALVEEPAGWRVDPRALDAVRSSRQAGVFLSRRLELLPAPARRLLTAGAVLGKEFGLELAAGLAGQGPDEALEALGVARSRHIVWVDEGGGRCTFMHDKLRESLLDRLGDEERRELHGAAARRIEALDPERVFELAYHYDAAGEPERALPHALAAAEGARSQHALEVSERNYRIAARGAGGAEPAVQRTIAEGLGDVLMLRGRYDEAEAELVRARALAESAPAQAEVQRKLGELAFKRGDVATAADALERALAALGRSVPRGRAGMLLRAMKELAVQVLHTLLPRLFLARRRPEGAESELLAIRIYSRLAYAYWFKRGAVATLWAHLREMNLAERYPPSAELAQAYSEHAPVMTVIPYISRGVDYVERSLAIRKDLGDVWGQGQSQHFYGVVLYAAGRYEECIERCEAAVRLLERTGDRWEVNTASWHVAFCRYRLGELAPAVEIARRVHRAGLEIGDHQASGISLGAWAKASGGRVPAELVQTELARSSDDVHTAAELLQAEGVRLLGEGRAADAAEALREARRRVRKAGLRQEYVAPIAPWLATALRVLAGETSSLAPRRRRAILREARRTSRRALRMARRYPNNLPHALRETGLVEGMRGAERRARRRLDQSLEHAERQGARHEAARTLMARGRLGLELGWDGAEADVAAAEGALRALEEGVGRDPDAPASPSLVDRFDTVLDAGRRIASALSREAIRAAVRDAALLLLRGEECWVLPVDASPGGEARVVPGGPAGPMDGLVRALAAESLASGGVVALADERPPSEAVADLAALAGVRSAMCAPILVRGRPAACLCLTSRQVSGLFGAEEERLAQFVATIAGAALENAEGFAEVQALSRSLERRVLERTAQLADTNRELDSSLRRLEAVLESLSDGVLASDSQGRVTLVNRAAREIHRLGDDPPPPEEWTERYGLYLPDGAEPMPVSRIPLVRALRGERVRNEEMIIAPEAGLRRTILASGQPIVDRENNRLGAVVALHDITDRKAAEAALERATRHIESILEAAGEGICGLDARGVITYANPAAARVTGYPAAELIGRRIDDLLGTASDAPEPGPLEQVVHRRDGTTCPVEYVRTDVQVGPGGGAGVVVLRDVSERRTVERMKDEFLALVSHELRTPLTSVLGFLGIVLEDRGSLSEEQQRFLEIAKRSADRLADLVEDVLLISQADAGRLVLREGAVDLRAVVRECAEAARPTAERRGIALDVEAAPVPPVLGDRARLAQVMDNLISNGLKFTASGGRVGVRVAAEDGRVVVGVSDTGIGIPETEHELIFTRFYRAPRAEAAAVPGTGLGLAVTRMIVDAHGGEILVRSDEGSGTTFMVTLPAS